MVLLLQDSPNIGACLCLGCWLEGGKELMGADVFEAIDWFGGNNPMGQNKLFKVVSATFLLFRLKLSHKPAARAPPNATTLLLHRTTATARAARRRGA